MGHLRFPQGGYSYPLLSIFSLYFCFELLP
nr:MAG TPA: hypothetical protein [Crassvirales sp.]